MWPFIEGDEKIRKKILNFKFLHWKIKFNWYRNFDRELTLFKGLKNLIYFEFKSANDMEMLMLFKFKF